MTEKAKHLKEAKQFAEKAVEVLSKKPEFRENWAEAILNLGIIFLRTQEEKATNQDNAIKLFEKSSEILTQDSFPNEWAINQLNLADAYLFRINGNKSENIEKAIEYCNKALSVHTRQSNPKEWGKVIHTMGKAYFFRLQGDPIDNLEKALDYYNQALEVFNQKYDSIKWAEIQVNLAALYIERKSGNVQKNQREAISCCENALLVYRKDRYPLGWANAHIELAIAHRNLENWEQSVSSFNYALDVYQADNFPGRYIVINSNLGTTYLRRASRESDTQSKLSYLKQAINCFEETLKIASEKGTPEDCIPPQLNLSSAYIEYLQVLSLSGDTVKQSDTEKVLESCRKCLDHFQQQGSPEMVVKVYTNLGKFYQNIQPDDDLAYKNFAKAIDQLENWRTNIISDEQSKQQWAAEYDFIYRHMISICLKMGTTRPEYNKKAFEYSERNKARSLVELINSRDRYPDNLSAIELERLKILKQQIIRIQQQLYLDDVYQFNNDLLNRTQLRQQLESLQKQKNQIIQDKKHSFTLKEQVTNLQFYEIQSLLANSENCAVSWYFLENTLVTFIITPQLSEPYVLLSDHESVFREIINWLSSYAEWSEEKDKNQRQIKHEEWMKSLPSRLGNLASSLKLDKIMEKLQQFEKEYNTQSKKLLLIPHWLLHLVPLHALPLSESNCLIDYFQQGVNYIPSCQLLQKISSYQKQLKFNQFFAIKNPTKDLFFASLEVEMIEKLVKPVAQNIKILHEDYATKFNLYQSQELKIADCLHFSCHGSFVAQIPLLSGLYLANKELLNLGEILELDLHNCYLITLSACETGQVDYHTLSEYVGLPSAFLYAGASSVVSSLWSVDDRATAFLLIKLYQNLLAQTEGEKNVIQALREAQRWLRNVTKSELWDWIEGQDLPLADLEDGLEQFLQRFNDNDKPFSSPYYWAAFCVIGK
ncbi:MAG: CHAT domain-containing protein [Nostocales cyanobacterium W4_Combined_metabat2_030]|nr:CHAT domain-containing protein [Nostocales cyanobacterium W4_Combined_metabat2_030]